MSHEDHAHPPPDGDLQPTAYALSGTLALTGLLSEEELRKGVDTFLAELTRSLRARGCMLIGHIKGILEAGDTGHLLFSVTSFEQRTRFKGGLTGAAEKLEFTLNVIVYGIGNDEVEQLVWEGLRKYLGELRN
jgi:hypothetical protein